MLCIALGVALWCRFHKSGDMEPSKSLSDEELARTTINPVANAAPTSIQMKVGVVGADLARVPMPLTPRACDLAGDCVSHPRGGR